MEIKTTSKEETQKVAKKFAKSIKAGDVIALYGKLGSGKTVFVKGIANGLGIKKRIISPTFIFMRHYQFNLDQKLINFYHIDLYRGNVPGDFESLGLDEILSKDAVVVIEWAEKIKKNLPAKRTDVFINTINKKTRRIRIDRRV